MSTNQRHTRWGAGRGVSQANEAAINPKLTGLCQHEIVSEIQKKWDCASHVWVPGRSRVHGRLNLKSCSITLQHLVSGVCRWMQNSKRSRLVPFLSGGGTGRGVWGVGGFFRGVHPNKFTCL